MSIMITVCDLPFLLAPIATNFYTLENFLCHYIVPLWFLADTLFFDKQGQYKNLGSNCVDDFTLALYDFCSF